jgi:hypothetical protein
VAPSGRSAPKAVLPLMLSTPLPSAFHQETNPVGWGVQFVDCALAKSMVMLATNKDTASHLQTFTNLFHASFRLTREDGFHLVCEHY